MGTLWKTSTMLLLAFGSLSRLWAQPPLAGSSSQPATFTLSGKIVEKGGDHKPVLGGSLYLESAANTLTASTPSQETPSPLSFSVDADLKGNYQVSVLEGVYRLAVAGEGYKKKTTASLDVPQDFKKDFYLDKAR